MQNPLKNDKIGEQNSAKVSQELLIKTSQCSKSFLEILN